jgi:hypothetical protein
LFAAWYSAGSTFVVLLLLLSAAGLYFYFKARKRYRLARIALDSNRPRDEEERVPLGPESFEMDDAQHVYDRDGRNGHDNDADYKGKARQKDYATDDVVFELGDDDER